MLLRIRTTSLPACRQASTMRTGLLRFTLHAVGGTAFLACVLACGTPTGKMDQEEKKVDDKQSLSSEQPTNNSQSQPVGPTNGNFHATRELFKVGEVIRVQDGRVEPWLMADDKTHEALNRYLSDKKNADEIHGLQ